MPAVSRVSFAALGGTVSTEPFNYFPSLRELETVVLVDGINVEEVMALTRDLPAKARTLPSRDMAAMVVSASNITSTCPPTMSVRAPELPL